MSRKSERATERRQQREKPAETPAGSSVLSRRNFLFGGIGMGIIGASYAAAQRLFITRKYGLFPSQQAIQDKEGLHPDVSSFLENFPVHELAEMPALADIRMQVLEKSQRLLIHILQLHVRDLNEPGQIPQEIERVQQHVYEILTFLHRHEHVRLQEIYGENLNESAEKQANKNVAIVRRGEADPDQKQMRASAMLRIAVATGIQLRAADNKEIVARAQELAIKEHSEGKLTETELKEFATVSERRESHLLKLITKQANSRIAVTVFGGYHDFKNNVEEWNAKHPEDAFGLMTITPTF